MATANCPKCGSTSFSGTYKAPMGQATILIYCSSCGAVVGAVNKT